MITMTTSNSSNVNPVCTRGGRQVAEENIEFFIIKPDMCWLTGCDCQFVEIKIAYYPNEKAGQQNAPQPN